MNPYFLNTLRGHILVLLILFTTTAFAQIGNFVVPNGHSGGIKAIKVDEQGKYVYSMEAEKVIMWDSKTNEQLYTFMLNANRVDELAISHDGTKIAIAMNSRIICFSTVTGKELFKTSYYYYESVSFSLDDSKLYSINDGIVVIDVKNGDEKRLVKSDFSFINARTEVLDGTHILIHNDHGWQKWDLQQLKMEAEVKLPQRVFRHTYLPQYGYIAANSNTTQLEIRQISTGELVKTFPIGSNDYIIVPSVDSKELIFNTGGYNNSVYTLYNATLGPVKALKSASQTSLGYFYGSKSKLFSASYADISLVDTKNDKILSLFKRQVANLGSDIFSSLEYNHRTGVLNILTDGIDYKSINLVKLMPFRHQTIKQADLMAFSPTGDTVAVFDDRTGFVKNIRTGKMIWPLIKLPEEAAVGERNNFFFSKNGNFVYYCTFSIPKQMNTMRRLNLKTGLSESMFGFLGSDIPFLHPDKDLLAALEVGYKVRRAKVWNVNTGKVVFEKNLAEDGYYSHITLSQDKKKLLLIDANTLYTYDLANGALLTTAKAKFNGTTGIYGSNPDQSLILLADAGMLSAVNAKGELIYKVKAHNSEVRRILFSPDAKTVYTVGLDQNIKVWEASSGLLLGTLYLFNDGNDFVFLDAYGRFDGTPNGIKRMYYYSNRIKIQLDVVYEVFYTPNLYQRLVTGERFAPINMNINPLPVVKIVYEQKTRNLTVEDEKPIYSNTSGIAALTINATAANDKVDEIRLFHNGKAVNLATRGLFVTDNTTGADSKQYTINLLPGVNTFRAIALNSQRTESLPDKIMVNYQAGNEVAVKPSNTVTTKVATIEKSATLHLIVVGINTYQNPKLSLNYALADATALKTALEKESKSLVSNLKTYFITDLQANKKGITDAFAEVQKNAKPQDVFIFYYAGHGVISEQNKEFYLVPTDVSDLKNVDQMLKEKGIAAQLIQDYAVGIQAQKQLFILDACQSAGAFQQLLTADANQQKSIAMVARSTGTHWMAASGAQQFANEFAQLGHGAFTYVLLQALKGEAASNQMVTVNGLKQFLQIKVPELMKKYNGTAQYPASYGLGSDFPVGLLQ